MQCGFIDRLGFYAGDSDHFGTVYLARVFPTERTKKLTSQLLWKIFKCTYVLCKLLVYLVYQLYIKSSLIKKFTVKKILNDLESVLRSRNYLFLAPAPHFPFTSAPAPAPAPASAIYCHLKLYYNSSTIRNMSQWRFFFNLSSSKLTAGNIY